MNSKLLSIIIGVFVFFSSIVNAQQKPNILIIVSDDHAYQAISAYQHSIKLVPTPNLDRLAKEGMLFHRAMVPNSICGPSRATVMTGQGILNCMV